MDIFEDRIKPLFEKSGLNDFELEKAIGLPRTIIYDWKKGRNKSYKKYVDKIASYFGVSTDYLLGAEIKKAPAVMAGDTNISPVGGMVPVVGVIRAGVPLLAEENISGYEFADVKDPENYFYLTVTGDSMINARIFAGSKVLVRKQNCAENGQIVVCRVNGEEATLKRFKQKGDTVLLLPENPAYEPLIISCKDFETGYAEIMGVAKKVLSDLC